ncbi:KM727_gp54-like protein [Aratus pisonii nudivirus]|nr:KM727_gp54-like protein [Aratus pisonii nudivirus]
MCLNYNIEYIFIEMEVPKIEKFVINLESDESEDDDDDDEEMQQEDLVLPTTTEETLMINKVIQESIDVIVSTDSCKLIHSEVNQIVEDEFKDLYEKYISNMIDIEKNKSILIPYYTKHVAFSKIKWVYFNANNNLNKKFKLNQLHFLCNSNPAMWICDENIPDKTKIVNNWLKDVNELDYKKSEMFESDEKNNLNKFILLEYNYLNQTNDDSNNKGLCGLCLLLCELNKNSKLQVLDIANIKVSCNQANRIYGNIITFLEKYPHIPIFVYIPQNLNSSVLLNTYLFPWSYFLTIHYKRIFNLVNMIQLESKSLDLATQNCIDKDIHYKSCAICNCLNLFMKLAFNKFESRVLSETLNNNLINPFVHENAVLPKYIVCKDVTFMTYGNIDKIQYKICSCQKKISTKMHVL